MRGYIPVQRTNYSNPYYIKQSSSWIENSNPRAVQPGLLPPYNRPKYIPPVPTERYTPPPVLTERYTPPYNRPKYIPLQLSQYGSPRERMFR